MGKGKEPRTVKSVQTALNIIELLQERTEAGVTEVAAEVGRSKGTIHSHLATLKKNDYVVKKGDTYRLSLKYLELAEEVKGRISGYDIVREELESLAAESEELTQFATEEHGMAVYLYKAAGEKAVQTASSPGKREYLHCIALGKVMLAHMPEDRVNEIIDTHGMYGYTEQTITSREALQDELEAIRKRGYAYDKDERFEGIRCIAAPVKASDKVFGAISVSGPSTRMEGEWYHEELPSMVTRSANVIEINIKFA